MISAKARCLVDLEQANEERGDAQLQALLFLLPFAKSPICKHDRTAGGRAGGLGWAIGYQIAASEVTTETKTKERRNCCVDRDRRTAQKQTGSEDSLPFCNGNPGIQCDLAVSTHLAVTILTPWHVLKRKSSMDTSRMNRVDGLQKRIRRETYVRVVQ